MSVNNEIFVFIFDSGKIENVLCEKVVFENMLMGKELLKNNTQVIVSSGSILPSIKHIDIEPYILKDDYCTIDFDIINSINPLIGYPYCWILEDLSDDIAKEIDERLKQSFNAYIGMAHIDINNKSIEKQFWKEMIRKFGIIKSTIINFKTDKEFFYLDLATKLNYKVIHLQHDDDTYIEHCKLLQSSKIKSNSDLEIKIDNKKNIDRNLMVLNFSLREEIQISGVLIWRSINELNKIEFNNEMKGTYLVEYPFLTLYTASQGIERIQKIIIELICKKEHIKEIEKQSVYKLLMSHSHNALNAWIENKTNIKFNADCKKLIDILYRFYAQGRYFRYSDEKYSAISTYEYSLFLELKNNSEEDIDYSIKNNFGKYLGKLVHAYYAIVYELCHKLNIYTYEIEYASSALIVYNCQEKPKNLYQELLFRNRAKKELLYWLIKKGIDYPKYDCMVKDVLEFDPELVESYLYDLINNLEDGEAGFETFSELYDDLYYEDKNKWKERIDFIDYIFSKY